MANILIVDDSRTSRKILKEILQSEGHTIIGEAVDGEAGYLKYKELKPDLVTMDVTMPHLNGIEALQLIKKFDDKARVIMITASGQKGKILQAVKYGAAEFIVKPYEDEDVKRVVEKVLNS